MILFIFVQDGLLFGHQFFVGDFLIVEDADDRHQQLWLFASQTVRLCQMLENAVVEALLDVSETFEITLDLVELAVQIFVGGWD